MLVLLKRLIGDEQWMGGSAAGALMRHFADLRAFDRLGEIG